jgi:hypothetical protein
MANNTLTPAEFNRLVLSKEAITELEENLEDEDFVKSIMDKWEIECEELDSLPVPHKFVSNTLPSFAPVNLTAKNKI